MKTQKYSVNQHLIETLLAWVKSGEIAIPEIQRPFVWDSTKVRDLMDSLYQGYPIGYIITWRNPDIRYCDYFQIFSTFIFLNFLFYLCLAERRLQSIR